MSREFFKLDAQRDLLTKFAYELSFFFFYGRMGLDLTVQQSTWMERRNSSELDLGTVDQNNPAT